MRTFIETFIRFAQYTKLMILYYKFSLKGLLFYHYLFIKKTNFKILCTKHFNKKDVIYKEKLYSNSNVINRGNSDQYFNNCKHSFTCKLE